MLRSMSGGMKNLELNIPNEKDLSIFEKAMSVGTTPRMLIESARNPFLVALTREKQFHTGKFTEFTETGQKVGMNVGFRSGHDLEIMLLRQIEVAVNIPHWIENDGFTGALTANEITVLR